MKRLNKVYRARKTVKLRRLQSFINKYGIACGSNWAHMVMQSIKNGLPEVYESLDDKKEYTLDELETIIKENI